MNLFASLLVWLTLVVVSVLLTFAVFGALAVVGVLS